MNNAQVQVRGCYWNDNFKDLAETIARMYPHSGRPKVAIYCYSWGAGNGMVKLANALKGRGVGVDMVVASDPVYHSRSLVLRWMALIKNWLPIPVIRVPKNVRWVAWYRQTSNRPAGCTLEAEDDESPTFIEPPTVVDTGRRHQYMDDLPEFHSRSLAEAGNLHAEGRK